MPLVSLPAGVSMLNVAPHPPASLPPEHRSAVSSLVAWRRETRHPWSPGQQVAQQRDLGLGLSLDVEGSLARKEEPPAGVYMGKLIPSKNYTRQVIPNIYIYILK